MPSRKTATDAAARDADDALATYRSKRSAARTPEPVPAEAPLPRGRDDTFVIQEHHARRLHWDFRLERDGVLVSWALPKGLPDDPRRNHLAVQTEDHPLDYAGFAGEIPAGQYGGGTVEIWDRGTYECEKWTADEVKVVLHGGRAEGRFALIHTGDRNWLIHLMKPPAPAGAPASYQPMLATAGTLPEDDDAYGYELKWDGLRAIASITGGALRLTNRNGVDITDVYPELAQLADAIGGLDAVLDGEITAADASGRVSFGALQPRMHLRDRAQTARLAESAPVSYQIFDVMRLAHRHVTALPYTQRRELLDAMDLGGPRWHVSAFTHGGGAELLATAVRNRVEGIMAKRLDSPYLAGARSSLWLKVKNIHTQEVVVGGWRAGSGNRTGTIGSLLLGIPDETGLVYVGHVGTGFTRAMLDDLYRRLRASARATSPFAAPLPTREARDAHWVTPRLVGEVAFAEWTRDGRLRQPAWRGLRSDKPAEQVRRESIPPDRP